MGLMHGVRRLLLYSFIAAAAIHYFRPNYFRKAQVKLEGLAGSTRSGNKSRLEGVYSCTFETAMQIKQRHGASFYPVVSLCKRNGRLIFTDPARRTHAVRQNDSRSFSASSKVGGMVKTTFDGNLTSDGTLILNGSYTAMPGWDGLRLICRKTDPCRAPGKQKVKRTKGDAGF